MYMLHIFDDRCEYVYIHFFFNILQDSGKPKVMFDFLPVKAVGFLYIQK